MEFGRFLESIFQGASPYLGIAMVTFIVGGLIYVYFNNRRNRRKAD